MEAREILERAVNGAEAGSDFERAVEAVVDGDTAALASLLAADAGLTRARAGRAHRATLLHYVAANGVEEERQRSPASAVPVARLLLEAGAEVDALALMYGDECTTLSLLVSSRHPAAAGVQVALVDLLADYGATLDDCGVGRWVSPVETALVFGYGEAARALVRRGAPVKRLAGAAGLGLVAETRLLLGGASAEERQRALAVAAVAGAVETAGLLWEAGVEVNRFNPEGAHAHSTPLHQAAGAGHLAMVQWLVAAGARGDVPDKVHGATALGWAEQGGHATVAAYLRSLQW